jgi:CRP-like cAMP-binding protein
MPASASDLAGTPFGNLLSDEQLATLAERFAPRTYAIGAYIVRAGQPSRQVHLIRRGRVLLYSDNDQGERVVLRECRPGEQFGEVALLDEAPSPFSAMALEETVALGLDGPDFEELLATYPQVGREVLRALSRRLRESMEALRAQSASNLDAGWRQSESEATKLARWVARLAGSWVFFVVFAAVLAAWMYLGRGISWPIFIPDFDPFPYILLNLVLTTMAAINAPIILVVVNGLNERNRLKDKMDFESDTRVLAQVAGLNAKLDEQNHWIEDHLDLERVARLEAEVNDLRKTLDAQRSWFEQQLAAMSPRLAVPTSDAAPAVN